MLTGRSTGVSSSRAPRRPGRMKAMAHMPSTVAAPAATNIDE